MSTSRSVSVLVALVVLVRAAGPAAAQEYTQGQGTDGADYPFVPTPPEVVAEMLEMADVSARDSVYDLGSGDGRIVPHDFDMEGWQADSVTKTPGGLGGEATLYLWIVPARVGGIWALSLREGDTLRVRIDQRFQEVRARVPGSPGVRVSRTEVVADTLRLELNPGDGAGSTTLVGTVAGDRISGRIGGGRFSGRRVAESDSSLTAWQGEEAGSAGGEGSAARSGGAGTPR